MEKEKNARATLVKSKGDYYNLKIVVEGYGKEIELIVVPLANSKVRRAKIYSLLSHHLPKE